MSKTEILEELPKLTKTERQEIRQRLAELDSDALLVLMATLENSPHPKLLANTAKHFAFNRCGELNLHGMVDAEIKTLESELFTADTFVS